MGARALVAYERDPDRYDLHESQWGAHRWALAAAIAPGTSPGDPEDDDARVEADPVARDQPLAAIRDRYLDYQLHEALYLVSADRAVRPFAVCWFGLPGVDRERPRDGCAVAVDPSDPARDGAFLSGWCAGAKDCALELHEHGVLGADAARSLLATLLFARVADERTLLVGPDVDAGRWSPTEP
ncbi:MAG: DUF6735 family protein [Haloarculaceae archaeon]